MIYRLVILNGPRRGERITVTPEPMSIGSDAGADIHFDDPEVALQHAEVSHTPEGLSIRDRGSMNRVLVNNREVRAAQLKHGDVVEVGRTRFLVQAYVQAEVQGEAGHAGRRRRRWVAGGSVALVALLAGIAHCVRSPASDTGRKVAGHASRTTPPAAAGPAAIGNRTPSVVTPPPVPPEKAASEAKPAAAPSPAKDVPLSPPDPTVAEAVAAVDEARGMLATSNTLVSAADAVVVARRELEAAAAALLESKVKDMLEEARVVATNEGPAAAERLLATIEKVKPDFLDASATRAAMIEAQGKLDHALALWTEIRERGEGTQWGADADDKIRELACAKEKPLAPFAGRVAIAGAEISKFPESDTFREMRLLSVRLTATELQKELDADAVRVEVRFYDRNRQDGRIVPTDARVPTNTVTISGVWRATENRDVALSYVVPAEAAGAGRVTEYYGFAVRVYYHGGLQDERIQPKDLLADVALAGADTVATNAPVAETPAAPRR